LELTTEQEATEQTKTEQTYTTTVTGYGSEGEGVARLDDGRVVFVRGAARGDILEIKLIRERSRSARAEISRILTHSPYRIEPGCPVFPECGGCDFQHLTYEEELDAKLRRVNDALERIGGQSARTEEILRTGRTEGYRNKAVFHSDGQTRGFYCSGSHRIVPVTRCLLLKDDLNAAIKNPAPVGEITLRSGRNGVSNTPEEELDGLVFEITGFFQINTDAALLLFNRARQYAALSKNETLVDLYCGVGSMTLFVGRDAGKAIGVELDPAAVETARKNARRNGLSHIEFIAADAALWETETSNPDCVIIDPPRKGLSQGALRKVLELSPKRIIYVSCDPATLARDIRMLEGYAVREVCAVDMFPRTAQVECCCLLVKSGR